MDAAAGYLPKPYTRESLGNAVAEALAGGRVEAPTRPRAEPPREAAS